LQKLANEKLAAQAEKLKAEGWAWIEMQTDHDYGFTSKVRRDRGEANGCAEEAARQARQAAGRIREG
jgi:ParB family chromosome partitioning protein